ncbi:hypothetical protein [Streptomyces sp. WAC 04229]|uniref:hypothetical protein n=1 Tax=Streptomyces sp. WAC 04229 TaxID=2203206 RepID=UPI000F73ECDD|nr:hypothetical protein [Streptomyces sp. WAC 04229]
MAGKTVGIGTVVAMSLALIQDQSTPGQRGVTTPAATTLRTLGSAAEANGIAVLTAALDTI